MKKFKQLIVTEIILLSVPLISFAQSIVPPNPSSHNLPGLQSTTITDVLEQAIQNVLLPIVGLIAVLFIIIGGFRYITSAGNEEQAEGAKKTLTNAIIGLVIVILSYVIVAVIANQLLP